MDLVALPDWVLSWGLGILILLASLLPYLRSHRKSQRATEERLREARERNQDKALMQHPIINRSLCIGCGICVEVCPEGGVLGVIDGKATIIQGSHCVGHGLCAENCPIGAIEIGLGEIAEREDIPQLDDHFQSSIPGLYLIGELSGLALIKNAIQHGVTAIDHLAALSEPPGGEGLDVLIVGAGPAGLTAALRVKERGLNYLVVDQDTPGGTILHYPRRKVTLVQPVDLPLFGTLKKREYTKEELLDIWERVIREQDIQLKTGEKLVSVVQTHPGFSTRTSGGTYSSRFVILALGRRGTPRKLGVPGEELPKVMYRLLDAETYRDRHILVVGGGDSAIEAAIGLAHQRGNTVTLSYRKEHFFRLKARNEKQIERALEKSDLKVVFNSNVQRIEPNHVILETPDGDLNLPNDDVFIFVGGELPFGLLNEIGIQFGPSERSPA